tara:strand:- start:1492 stop:2049 length:558 start_codon:yes stop_codon:yes gene_type:complete
MDIIGKDFKYKKIENFLSKDEIEICNLYCEMKHRVNQEKFDEISGKLKSLPNSFFYGDALMESIMLKKKDIMENETGKKLLPTYSYWRMYTKYSDLKKHKDRPSCEISATINIGSDGTDWPIYMEGNKIDLNPGDAVIYLGCELEHHREEFKGDWYAQVFIHYVDEAGNNKSFEKDKRVYWGLEK